MVDLARRGLITVDGNHNFLDFESETALSEQRKRKLTRKLVDIIEYAFNNSAAFKNRLNSHNLSPNDFKEIKDLEKLSTFDKNDILKTQSEDPPFGGMLGVDLKDIRRIYRSPGPIYEPGERVYEDSRWAQAFRAIGIGPGDIAVNTFSYHMTLFGFWLDDSLNSIGATIIPSGPGNTDILIELMAKIKVTTYLGTPSFLHSLSEKALSLGYDLKKDMQLRYGFVAAEMLPESLRLNLENLFGMRLLQSYGTADIGCLGFECGACHGMHVPEDVIVEILDPETGKSLPAGEIGEIVATNFCKEYPLIRFATGDLSYFIDEPCDCGRTSPRLGRILGRVDQLTKVRGMFIHPSQVIEVMQGFPEVKKFQVIVDRFEHKDSITLLAKVQTAGIDNINLKTGIENALKNVVKLRIEVDFVGKDEFIESDRVIIDKRVWD
jgi:phenylacetate-CoA ligase